MWVVVLVADDTTNAGIGLGWQLEGLVLLKHPQALLIVLIGRNHLLVELALAQRLDLFVPRGEWLFGVGLGLHAVPRLQRLLALRVWHEVLGQRLDLLLALLLPFFHLLVVHDVVRVEGTGSGHTVASSQLLLDLFWLQDKLRRRTLVAVGRLYYNCCFLLGLLIYYHLFGLVVV